MRLKRFRLRAMLYGQAARHQAIKGLGVLSCFASTLIGAVLARGVLSLEPTDAQDGVSLHLAVGGMIGTVLAIVVSLSILPVQRATESAGRITSTVYLKDRIVPSIYVLLGFLCLLSFFLAMARDVFGMHQIWIVLELVIIGVVLDALRWYSHRVNIMLQPHVAIQRLRKTAIHYIQTQRKLIAKLAAKQWRINQAKSPNRERIEGEFWRVNPNLNRLIGEEFAGEMAEAAVRAVARDETGIARDAITGICEIACCYLEARMTNAIFYPHAWASGTMDSDLTPVLNPMYEHLRRVFIAATSRQAQVSCIDVLHALAHIAVKTTSIGDAGLLTKASLSFMPLGHLLDLSQRAQASGLDDVALNGSRQLLHVCENTPEDVLTMRVYSGVVESWSKLSQYWLSKRGGICAGAVFKDMMGFVNRLVERKDEHLMDVVQAVLRCLEPSVPLIIANQGDWGSGPFQPYDIAGGVGLDRIMATAVEHRRSAASPDEAFRWDRTVMELNKHIWGHFRHIVEKTDLSGSFLLWHIRETIKSVALSLLRFAKSRRTEDNQDTTFLRDVGWTLSPLEFVFHGSKLLGSSEVDDICDTLCFVGLAYYSEGYRQTALDAVMRIPSIIGVYCGMGGGREDYTIADLMIHIWKMRVLIAKGDDSASLQTLDGALTRPSTIPEERWDKVLEEFELRKAQLEEDLHSPQFSMPMLSSTELLKSLLYPEPEV
jgi:hypothetical protein